MIERRGCQCRLPGQHFSETTYPSQRSDQAPRQPAFAAGKSRPQPVVQAAERSHRHPHWFTRYCGHRPSSVRGVEIPKADARYFSMPKAAKTAPVGAAKCLIYLVFLVGGAGFEPATPAV